MCSYKLTYVRVWTDMCTYIYIYGCVYLCIATCMGRGENIESLHKWRRPASIRSPDDANIKTTNVEVDGIGKSIIGTSLDASEAPGLFLPKSMEHQPYLKFVPVYLMM